MNKTQVKSKVGEKKYMIFDASAPLLMDIPYEEAKNAKKAIEQYCKKNNMSLSLKKGGINTRFMAEQFEIVNGIKYKKGRKVWFSILTPNP